MDSLFLIILKSMHLAYTKVLMHLFLLTQKKTVGENPTEENFLKQNKRTRVQENQRTYKRKEEGGRGGRLDLET